LNRCFDDVSIDNKFVIVVISQDFQPSVIPLN